jgi:hypothetical protein
MITGNKGASIWKNEEYRNKILAVRKKTQCAQ